MTTDIQNIGAVAVPMPGAAPAVLRSESPPGAARASRTPAEPAPIEATPTELKQALDELVQRASDAGAELNFRIDDDLGRVIVSVVDPSDGKVLRQMPTEEALRIARALERYQQHLIEMRA